MQIANGDGTVQAAPGQEAPAAPAGDEVDRAISELDRATAMPARPPAWPNSGGDGSLQEGYRVERIGEALGTAEVPRSNGDAGCASTSTTPAPPAATAAPACRR